MILQVKLVNITITEDKTLSLKVRVNEAADDTILLSEINRLKGEQRRYTMKISEDTKSGIYFTGMIKSMNIVKGIMIVLHTPAIPGLVVKAIYMIGQPASLRFLTSNEHELLELVKAASRLKGIEPEDIVHQLTTFTKNGRTIEGKTSIFDISENQRKVVLSKLHKILSEQQIPTNA